MIPIDPNHFDLRAEALFISGNSSVSKKAMEIFPKILKVAEIKGSEKALKILKALEEQVDGSIKSQEGRLIQAKQELEAAERRVARLRKRVEVLE